MRGEDDVQLRDEERWGSMGPPTESHPPGLKSLVSLVWSAPAGLRLAVPSAVGGWVASR